MGTHSVLSRTTYSVKETVSFFLYENKCNTYVSWKQINPFINSKNPFKAPNRCERLKSFLHKSVLSQKIKRHARGEMGGGVRVRQVSFIQQVRNNIIGNCWECRVLTQFGCFLFCYLYSSSTHVTTLFLLRQIY